MRAAFDGVNVVAEGEYVFGVAVVVLHGHFDGRIAALALDVDRLGVERLLVFIEIFDKLADAAFVVERAVVARAALVDEPDADALVEEGHLAQALLEHLVLENAGFKHAVGVLLALDVGLEADIRAGFVGVADDAQIVVDLAAMIFLLVDVAVLIDGHLQPA